MLLDIHGDIWTDVTVKSAQGIRNIIRDYHLERFKKGNMAGGIFVIWADPPHDLRPQERLIESIRAMSKELMDSRDIVQVMKRSEDFSHAIAHNKLAVMLGLEGLSGIGEDIEALYPLYQLGFRHASLTWNEQNALATGVKGDPSRGLTAKGKEAASLIHELGMILDVSHANDKTFWDIADLSDKPIIASHSNARALCDVPRNLTDEQIKTIGSKNGLIGINAYNEFIHVLPAERTVDRLIDHLVHIAGLIGIEKIALGFDFFEYLSSSTTDSFTSETYAGTIGLEDITKAPNMISRLSARGFTREEIEQISHKNFLSLMDRVLI
ncbi:dipeptidase [Acidaminobacter hydrogenoformans]|uniref:Membrane dipeptidase n=1 Tax=Acidaminobacter hydrogenoformans DSM 2784 TaxID=1120920 RepID=A0A1G5S1M2_9FIRM|nr:membrane dipeptidase [Acidaminobacter hydrogenoformans]SCZ80285.1 membrane dipeptidase [Acidaminobacter hydrogenoformans DSM 2784]